MEKLPPKPQSEKDKEMMKTPQEKQRDRLAARLNWRALNGGKESY